MTKTEAKKEVAKLLNTTSGKIKTLSFSWGVYQFAFENACYMYFITSKNLRRA